MLQQINSKSYAIRYLIRTATLVSVKEAKRKTLFRGFNILSGRGNAFKGID
jgi:hypothetical protein